MPKRKLKPIKDGRYEAKIYLGLNEERKKKYLTVYGNTIAELEAKEREIRLKIQKGRNKNSYCKEELANLLKNFKAEEW